MAGGVGSVLLEKAGDFFVEEADDEVVVHAKGGGSHVGRADEDGFIVENEDFLMHESGHLDGVDFAAAESPLEFGRAFYVVVDGGGDSSLIFLARAERMARSLRPNMTR